MRLTSCRSAPTGPARAKTISRSRSPRCGSLSIAIGLTRIAEGRTRTSKDFKGQKRNGYVDPRRALPLVRQPDHAREIRPDPGRDPQGRTAQARRRRKADPRAAGEGDPRPATEARGRAREDPQAAPRGGKAPQEGDRRHPPDPP